MKNGHTRSFETCPPPEKAGSDYILSKILYFFDKRCYTSDVMRHYIKDRLLGFRLAEIFSPHPSGKCCCAFTLAEVLITLGIIGVVAALTMPSLIADHREKETVAKLKKVYSTLDNAYMLARNEHGETADWFTGTNVKENSEIFFNKLKPYLNIAKDCGFQGGCLTEGYVKTLDGRTYTANYNLSTQEYRFVLADGTQAMIYLSNPTCNTANCGNGNIKVDIDGYKGRYTIGKDFFILRIEPQRIFPIGIKGDTSRTFETYCNKSGSSEANGIGCSAWVIFNENMDYLHCNDLNWDTKTKCK